MTDGRDGRARGGSRERSANNPGCHLAYAPQHGLRHDAAQVTLGHGRLGNVHNAVPLALAREEFHSSVPYICLVSDLARAYFAWSPRFMISVMRSSLVMDVCTSEPTARPSRSSSSLVSALSSTPPS